MAKPKKNEKMTEQEALEALALPPQESFTPLSDLKVRACGHVCREIFISQTFCDVCAGGGWCGCELCHAREAA